MGSSIAGDKPHTVCIPFPAQGHITPMLKLAKLLHSRGFHVTFVNTEYNHNRLLKSRGPSALDGPDDFQFATIPDGLPPSDQDATQDIPSLCDSITRNFFSPFRRLLADLNHRAPPVSCIISNGFMTFTLDAADELRIPEILFWSTSACGFMGYLQYKQLVDRGLFPLKDERDLDAPIDWVPGIPTMRLRDFPSFNYCSREAQRASKASAIILNTFDELERPVLDGMASNLPAVYTVGPLSLLSRRMPESTQLSSLGSNLWREEPGCIEWLSGRPARSVVYVNFGSITVMTNAQLVEFAWGLADSRHEFLWVMRPDLVRGETSEVLPAEFLAEVEGRGMLASWCRQEEVLSHPAVGGFLTHSGWNSTVESVSAGVPMLCWPFFAEQPTNTRLTCGEWGVGMEIDSHVRRKEVEGLIRELMGGGEKGREMRMRALGWKERAVSATERGGSSFLNFERLVNDLLMKRFHQP